jgi:hypothetical protein
MSSSGMLCHVTRVRTDVLEEHITFFTRVTRISELGTMLALTGNHSVLRLVVTAKVVPSSPIPATLMTEVICSSDTSVLTRATWHNKQPPWPLVRKRTIPTERQPPVDEI